MGLLRADVVERAALIRAINKAMEYRHDLDEQLARMIANTLVEAWNKGQRR